MNASMTQFVFNGLMTRHCIRDMRNAGLLRTPAVTAAERKDQDLFAPVSEDVRTSSIEMSRVFRFLYVFENILREFIDTRFTEEDKTSSWFEKRGNSKMKERIEDRKRDEAENQWHIGRNEGDLFYLDFGDLANLVTTHWSVFKDFFPNQSWITTRIEEAKRSRNVIAHTNILAAEESQRLEMYLRDVIKQIG